MSFGESPSRSPAQPQRAGPLRIIVGSGKATRPAQLPHAAPMNDLGEGVMLYWEPKYGKSHT